MSRENFEAWAKEQGYETYRQKTGAYFFEETHVAWQVWSAATASMQAERYQLAAECAGMDAFVGDLLAIAWQGCNADGADIQGIALKHGLIRQEVYCQDQHENLVEDPSNFEDGDPVYFRVEAPATDRFIAEQRAQGVEMFAKHIALYNSDSVQHAHSFAAQLRNGVKV